MRIFVLILTCISFLCAGCSDFSSTAQQESAEEHQANNSVPSMATGQDPAPGTAEKEKPDLQAVAIESLIREPGYRILGSKTLEAEQPPTAEPASGESRESIKKVSIAGAHPGQLALSLCAEIGAKLGSVDESDCLHQNLMTSGTKSVEGRDLAYKDYLPVEGRQPLGKVLVIGGIHGDEFSSVSVVFKWMTILNEHHSGLFHWRFIPAGNPDGLLNKNSQRQNANGVDLNRNFPTQDWDEAAKDHWIKNAFRKPRRFPGEHSNSEPETQWLVEQITSFQPDVIVSMHAPYHLVDYDGPPSAPDQLGSLYLRKLGVYPGSLGNYAGVDLEIPIVTVELGSAGIMPSRAEISNMWDDLIGWLRVKLSQS